MSTIFLSLFCLFIAKFVFGQWYGDGGMGGMEMGGGGGGMMGGGGGGGGGEGGGGMGNDELTALELLKTVMERRVASNRRLREQLDRTNRELRGANDELKTTRERIEELGTKCEQFGRIKDVLREKITEIEEIFENSEQGGGGGRGGGGGGGRGGGGGGQYMAAYGGNGGGGGGTQEIWSSGDEALTMPGMRARLRRESDGTRADRLKNKPKSNFADIALCELEPNIQHKLERELDMTQQRISRLKGMERKITVSLFLARLF